MTSRDDRGGRSQLLCGGVLAEVWAEPEAVSATVPVGLPSGVQK
jgi:hypothetical protein